MAVAEPRLRPRRRRQPTHVSFSRGATAQLTRRPTSDQPTRLLEEGLERSRALGNEANVATALPALGFAALMRDAYGEARRWFQKALEVGHRQGDKRSTSSAIVGIALSIAAQQPAAAAQLWGFAAAIRERLSIVPDHVDADIESPRVRALELALGPDAFAREAARGAELDLEGAVRFASGFADAAVS